MKPSFIFFDLDGTLADTMPQLIEYIAASLQRDFRLPESEARVRVPELLAMPASEMFASIMALGGIDLAAMPPTEAAAVIERYLGDANQIAIEPFEEVSEVLERLNQTGYTLFITTNAPQASLQERLVEAGLHHHFRRVFGTGHGALKGASHVRFAAEELGLSVEELGPRSALVGDTAADMRMALEAGMVAIARVTGDNADRLKEAGAHHVISDLRQLEMILDSL